MTELPTSSDTAAPPRLAASLHPSSRRTSGRRPNRPSATVRPAHLAASLTDLASMASHAQVIRGRSPLAPDLDQRLAGVIAELQSLIHDLLHDTGTTPNGAKPPTRVASSGAAGASDPTRAEAAFEAWLTSEGKPDAWQLGGPDEPPTSLTAILEDVVISRRQLPAASAAALRMRSGTTLGHAAAELLHAVSDPVGPCCRSYRSALYYLRDHDGTFVSR